MYNNLTKLAKAKEYDTKETRETIAKEILKSSLTTYGGGQGRDRANAYFLNKSMMYPEDVAKTNEVLEKLKQHSSSVDKSPSVPDMISTYNLPNNRKITILPDIAGVGDSSAHDARAIYNSPGVNEDTKKALHHVNTEPHKRSQIIFRASDNPNTLLHEIGHLTGRGRSDTLKHKLIDLNADLYAKSNKYVKGNSHLTVSSLLPTLAVGTRRKEGESEEQFVDRRQRNRHLLNAASTVPLLPMLAEEARASINAYKLGKKMGVPVDKRQLATAFGTYASTLVPNAVRAIADSADHKLDRAKLKNREDNKNLLRKSSRYKDSQQS